MRSHLLAWLAAALVAMPLAAVPAGASSAPAAPIDPLIVGTADYQSVLVHVRPGVPLASGIDAARAVGATIGTRYEAINVFVAYGSRDVFLRLAESAGIEALEANAALEYFTDTSHRATRGQDVLDGALTLPDGTRIDGRGVGVAVVDSGVDGTHPDLSPRMGGNVKIVCSTPQFVVTSATGGFTQCIGPKVAVPLSDTDAPSGGGHGTHVAGIVAGTGAASAGRWHGAAPGTTLYGVSVGTTLVVENALDGLAWVLENHDKVTPAIKVVNNSWGSGHRPYDPQNGPFHKATWKLQEALVAAGVTVVFAAGNSGGNGSTNTTSAECINPTPGIICVANYNDANSGTRDGTIDSTSSRGRTDQPQHWPDLSAPGTRIISTCRLTLPVCNAHLSPVLDPPNLYAQLSGTSMAAPHVAGIVAQLYQAKPGLTPPQVEDILEDTAYKFAFGAPYTTDPFNSDGTSSFEKGHGLVDVIAALERLGVPLRRAEMPDLAVTAISAGSEKAREGQKVRVTATVANNGEDEAGASSTEFLLDGATVLGTVETPALAPGATAEVSLVWDTRGVKGEHTIRATADHGSAVAESDEGNNAAVLTVSVKGNKVENGQFEQPDSSGSGPAGWSGASGGAGTTSWGDGGADGSKVASVSGNGGSAAVGLPSWTSDPVTVTAGETLELVVSVKATDASSAASAGLAYFGPAGELLGTVRLISAPLTTAAFETLQQTVTIPAGVAQVRVVLVGFSPTEISTRGTVTFDDVGLYSP